MGYLQGTVGYLQGTVGYFTDDEKSICCNLMVGASHGKKTQFGWAITVGCIPLHLYLQDIVPADLRAVPAGHPHFRCGFWFSVSAMTQRSKPKEG